MRQVWGRGALVMALSMIVLAGALLSRSPGLVAAATDCSSVVTNGGFEDPQVFKRLTVGGATGWSGSYQMINFPPSAFGESIRLCL